MNWRGLVTYTIPKIDVLISGILRSQANTEPLTIETGVATNGVGIAANYTVTPAILAANGQTPFAPGVTTQSVNLVPNSSLFADRVNSIDMRFGKILRFGGTRTNIGIDLYNMLNCERRHGLQPGVRYGWRDLDAPDGRVESALRALQRDVRFLIGS